MPPTAPSAPSGFDQVLHLRYRLYLPALLHLATLEVYDALRSCVWRTDHYGPEALVTRALHGVLAAQPSQRHLGEITGLARETVNRCLRKLEDLGWIMSAGDQRAGEAKVYDLGVKHLDSFGGAEVFYADAMMSKLYEAVQEAAQQVHGTTYRRLSASAQKALVQTALNLQPKAQPPRRKTSARTGATVMVPATFHLSVTALRDPCEGGVICPPEPPPTAPETTPFFAYNKQSLPAGRGVGGVIWDSGGCDRGSQVEGVTFLPKPLVSQRSENVTAALIDSIHIIPLTSFGRTLRTSYSESSLHSVGEPAQSQVEVDALRSPLALAPVAGIEGRSGGAYPLASPLTPVPPPPSPVTDSGVCVTHPCEPPTEASPVPVQRFNPSRTTPDPSEASDEASDPAGSVSMTSRLGDVTKLVEEAKARSREALATKVAKLRSKERKATNLASDKAYKGQRSGALRLEQVWKEEMSTAFPGIPQIAWFKRDQGKLTARKEGKLAADLLDGYGGEEGVVTDLIQTFVRYWSELGPMLTKQQDSVPTFGLLYACHATVAAEAPRLKRKHDVVAQYEAWKAENAGNDFAVPPPELETAYRAAMAKKGKR